MTALRDMKIKELKAEARRLHEAIFDCFSVGDMIRYEMACKELKRRGYESIESRKLLITTH